MLDENPYLQMPAPEEVKHIRDRYAHANKKEACWQIKWDLIHCITDSDCVKVEGNRARDCFNRRQVRFSQYIIFYFSEIRPRLTLNGPKGHKIAILRSSSSIRAIT